MIIFDRQNKSFMYIVITKATEKTAVIKEKTELSQYIDKSISTINRKKNFTKWELDKYIVYKADYVRVKSSRGGKQIPKDRE